MMSTTIDVAENIQTVLNKQSTKLNVRIPVEPHKNAKEYVARNCVKICEMALGEVNYRNQ